MRNAIRALSLVAAVLIAVLLPACVRNEEQAVRHVVIAELIQRYRINEENVRLVDIQRSGSEFIVRAEVRESGRAGRKQELICKVGRTVPSKSSEALWKVTTIEEGKSDAYPIKAPK